MSNETEKSEGPSWAFVALVAVIVVGILLSIAADEMANMMEVILRCGGQQ